jgi:hypothetical protein
MRDTQSLLNQQQRQQAEQYHLHQQLYQQQHQQPQPTTVTVTSEEALQRCTDRILTHLCEVLYFLPDYMLEDILVTDARRGPAMLPPAAGNDMLEVLPLAAFRTLVRCYVEEMTPAYKLRRPHWTLVLLWTLYFLREELRYRLVTLQLALHHEQRAAGHPSHADDDENYEDEDDNDDNDASTARSTSSSLLLLPRGPESEMLASLCATMMEMPSSSSSPSPSSSSSFALHLPHRLLSFFAELHLGKYIARSTLHRDGNVAGNHRTSSSFVSKSPVGVGGKKATRFEYRARAVVNAVTIDSEYAGFYPADAPSLAILGKYLHVVRQRQREEAHRESIRVMLLFWDATVKRKKTTTTTKKTKTKNTANYNDVPTHTAAAVAVPETPQEKAFQAMLSSYAQYHHGDFDLQSLPSLASQPPRSSSSTHDYHHRHHQNHHHQQSPQQYHHSEEHKSITQTPTTTKMTTTDDAIVDFLSLDMPSVTWLMQELARLEASANEAAGGKKTVVASTRPSIVYAKHPTHAPVANSTTTTTRRPDVFHQKEGATGVGEELPMGVALRSAALFASMKRILQQSESDDGDDGVRIADARGADSALLGPVPMPDGFDYKQYLSSYRQEMLDETNGRGEEAPLAATILDPRLSLVTDGDVDVDRRPTTAAVEEPLSVFTGVGVGVGMNASTSQTTADGNSFYNGRVEASPPKKRVLKPLVSYTRSASLNEAMFGDEGAGHAVLW